MSWEGFALEVLGPVPPQEIQTVRAGLGLTAFH